MLFSISSPDFLLLKWIESSPEKDMGLSVDEKLNTRQQRVVAAEEAKNVLSCMASSVASRLGEVTLHIYSALMTPCLECCFHFWSLT